MDIILIKVSNPERSTHNENLSHSQVTCESCKAFFRRNALKSMVIVSQMIFLLDIFKSMMIFRIDSDVEIMTNVLSHQ